MMQKWIGALNYCLLLYYGIALTMAFAGVCKNRRNRRGFVALFTFCTVLEVIIYQSTYRFDLSEQLYPLAVHLPVVLFLVFYCRKPWRTAISAMLSAYLFTMPRRWLANLFALPFQSDQMAYHIASILITAPLLWFTYRFFLVDVSEIINRKDGNSRLFVGFLWVYYLFNNATTVFTDILYSGNPAVTDALASCLVLCFFTLNILYEQANRRRQAAETLQMGTQNLLELAKNQIEQLRANDAQTRIYRHDMRHHLLLIRELAASGNMEKLLEYLSAAEKNVDRLSNGAYCANETANLIIASFDQLAQKKNVRINVKVTLPKSLPIGDVELCALISNGLENAIAATEQVIDGRQRTIRLESSIFQERLLITIENPYVKEPLFVDDLPVSTEQGHGMGAKSIRSIVQQNGGMCDFFAQEGVFILRMVL